MSDLQVIEQNQEITDQKVMEYLQAFGFADGLTKSEVTQFCEVAKAYQLNPFKREIYCVPYGEGDKRKLSIITGFETYLKRAERTGKLVGWKAWTVGSFMIKTIVKKIPKKDGTTWNKEIRIPVGDLKAIVEIHRIDWKMPLVHEVFLDEYVQANDMWGAKTRTMLKKVAIGQGFRLAFPDEMGGMPYTSEELPSEMGVLGEIKNVTEESPIEEKKEPEKQEQQNIDRAADYRVRMDAALNEIIQIMGTVDDENHQIFSSMDKDLLKKNMDGGLEKNENGKTAVSLKNAVFYESIVDSYVRERDSRLAEIDAKNHPVMIDDITESAEDQDKNQELW